MKIRLNIALTEQEYYNYNAFVNLKTDTGKKQVKDMRKIFFLIPVVFTLFALVIDGVSEYGVTADTLIPLIPVWMFGIAFMLLAKKFLLAILEAQIKKYKKLGKKLYSEKSVLIFSDECITEITPESRGEFNYSMLERVSVVGNEAIYLHGASAFIAPARCFESKEQYAELIEFLKTKCDNVQIY